MARRGHVLIILRGTTLPEPCVLTVGKFEGIHRGHRTGIERVVQLAKTKGVKSAVVAFSPHPHHLLYGTAYSPLFTQAERIFLLEQLGVDYLLEYPFDATLMKMSAAQFCTVLFTDLQAEAVIVGEDFRFGHAREGTIAFMREMAKNYGRTVESVPSIQNCAALLPISTSAIRALLEQSTDTATRFNNMSALEQITQLLGFPFFAMGIVMQGRQLGRKMGFPTLNLYPPPDKFLPCYGVYATRTTINATSYYSITNIGKRPTVNNGGTPTIETHLLSLAHDNKSIEAPVCNPANNNDSNKKTPFKHGVQVGSLYGAQIRVEFIRFIRAEIKFNGLEALQNQIAMDVAQVKDFYTITSAPVSIP